MLPTRKKSGVGGPPNLKNGTIFLEWVRPEIYGRRRKSDIPRTGGVLVIGKRTEKRETSSAANIKSTEVEVGFQEAPGAEGLAGSGLSNDLSDRDSQMLPQPSAVHSSDAPGASTIRRLLPYRPRRKVRDEDAAMFIVNDRSSPRRDLPEDEPQVGEAAIWPTLLRTGAIASERSDLV